MEASELRIGNYYNNNGELKKITISVLEDLFNSSRKWCEPIPLTEEWLLKFGFEKSEDYYTYWINEYKTFIMISNGYKSYSLCDCDIDTDIKYVHQLQNLYFALTQNELTIK